jgi:hypothetical protein
MIIKRSRFRSSSGCGFNCLDLPFHDHQEKQIQIQQWLWF